MAVLTKNETVLRVTCFFTAYFPAFTTLAVDMWVCRRIYSRNRKSVNAKNNFWNVYCSTTNQIRDVTATNRNSN